MRILLVDDDQTAHLILQALLTKMGHEVVHAYDGHSAWAILESEKISIVISDWRMPEMDGVTLCKKLRQSDMDHYIYFILITGKQLEQGLVIGLEAGADDFLTKPVNGNELRVRIESGKRIVAMEEALTQQNRQLITYQERINKDLEAAAAMQQDLLPKSDITPLPVNLAWHFMPADELAGDMFNFYALDERHLAFYLVDVSGHGIPAAMMSVHLAKILSPERRSDSVVFIPPNDSSMNYVYRQPRDVATKLNDHFSNSEDSLIYYTMIYGILDTYTGQGSVCQAGHPSPMIGHIDGRISRLGKGGFPIGLIPDADYDQVDFVLQTGERLLLFSDGITECFNPQEEVFGEEQLSQCLQQGQTKTVEQTVKLIETQLNNWCHADTASPSYQDDVSFFVIERS